MSIPVTLSFCINCCVETQKIKTKPWASRRVKNIPAPSVGSPKNAIPTRPMIRANSGGTLNSSADCQRIELEWFFLDLCNAVCSLSQNKEWEGNLPSERGQKSNFFSAYLASGWSGGIEKMKKTNKQTMHCWNCKPIPNEHTWPKFMEHV